ncbi:MULTISPECIES: ANR family transcriptional regulator [Pantoea]|uniref:ANR family transcriptional regulator n=1 Tax=Pantoea sp. YR525 TaxID=1884372 RepID=UPI001587DE8B|nr:MULTISPECIES: ANR family transcriptional regulator [Pantoea]
MRQGKPLKRNIRNIRYYNTAEAAAIAENFGHYEKAGKLWLKAMKLAMRQVNAEWSEHRSQFCQSVLRNGWSQK